MSSGYSQNITTIYNPNDFRNGQTCVYQDLSLKKFGSIRKRHEFVQKVFCNLTIMLTLTGLSCYAFMTEPNLKNFSQSHHGIIIQYLCGALMFATVFTTICCENAYKHFLQIVGV